MARQYETVVGPTQKVEQVGEAEVKREVPLAQAEKLPPLKQHYETDFKEGRGTLIMMESFNQDITFPDGKIVRIEYARHLNYAARSIFLAIYIPADTRAVAICEYVKDHIDDYTRSDLDIEMGGSGSEPERSSDLIFTGRVFVYHEGHIPLADRGALDAAYREKNLRLQFRSTDYVLAAMQGKKQATAASASS
ncbi:hypothetical protein sos41_21710 [Alphaproteobacteria bacterium SO-S41]|nr:hypothetical protein sos41_21710 [Alphaproteobacteria bacterium SO-S41]